MENMRKLPNLKITRKRLYEQVVQHLQDRIISGELQADDQLPPERQMAEQLGVSRTVIREAIKTLEQRGLVKVLTGSGTYVSQTDPEIVSESIGLLIQQRLSSFRDLNQVRRMLEIEIAGLAAERAGAEDIEAMEEALRKMEVAIALADDHPDRLERFIEADLAFHNALVETSQNPLLPVLLEPIAGQLLEFRRLASSAPGAMQDALSYHRKILKHLKAHDASACRELMREHLAKAEEWVSLATRQA
jgi:GntR family transcriptional repressor for pyruvate dehydrogenase complex